MLNLTIISLLFIIEYLNSNVSTICYPSSITFDIVINNSSIILSNLSTAC